MPLLLLDDPATAMPLPPPVPFPDTAVEADDDQDENPLPESEPLPCTDALGLFGRGVMVSPPPAPPPMRFFGRTAGADVAPRRMLGDCESERDRSFGPPPRSTPPPQRQTHSSQMIQTASTRRARE